MTARETLDTMDQPAREHTYVLGLLDDLKNAGIVEGGRVELTETGREICDILEKEGFKISDERLTEITLGLVGFSGGMA